MKRITVLSLLFGLLLIPVKVHAFAVHDAISNMTATIKTALDKVYQACKLEFDAEKIGLSTEQLTKMKESLKQLQDTYDRLTKVYDQVSFIRNNIGDPSKIAAYMNRNFTKSKDIDNLLTISDRCMNASASDLDLSFMRNILDEADQIAGGDYHETEARLRLEHQKREIAIRDSADQIIADIKDKYKELYKGSQELAPKSSSLTELSYANYKASEYQAGVLSQYVVAQQYFNTMLAERMKQEDARYGKSIEQRAKDTVESEEARKNISKQYQKEGSSTEKINELFDFKKSRAF